YVWFDAPIGYISITACLGDEKGFDWKSWWMNPREVELYQFIGKDNIPFHTVIFPSSLIGSGRTWTLLHHMSSTEYLNYESGKFSKSKGIGVFGNDAMESGIPADVWRFYIFYNRPEKSDVTFTWKDFQEKVNSELIGNLGNLVNRTLTFVNRFYDGVIPEAGPNEAFWSDARRIEREITEGLDRAELRESLHSAFALSALANKAFQDCEPWKARTENPAKAATLIRDLCYVLRDLAIIMHPYLPASAAKVAGFFGKTIGSGGLDWSTLGKLEGLDRVLPTEVLFAKLEDDQVNALRERHAGSQSERQARDDEVRKSVAGTAAAALVPTAGEAPKPDEPKPFPWADLPVEERFGKIVRLRVATIASITRHTKADKLYIETLDDGSGTERVIVSGLVPFYGEEELLGKRILIVDNLKSARLRGVESRGMLLAAEATGADGTEIVEVLDVSRAANGDIAVLEGLEAYGADEIDVDAFFSVPLRVEGGCVMVGTRRLTVDGEPVMTSRIVDGGVH
ncbi:MAG: class I tRNA ligase family protein, partial [Spirochaetes bacterium]|nr:class I tRNA ligase family protein [Spirochaetota bacterium]